MSGNSVFVDTNIIIYLLNGDETLKELLRDKVVYVSFISEIELLSYTKLKAHEREAINSFFESCRIVNMNERIKSKTIQVRSRNGFKVPDSIIVASAFELGIALLTADKQLEKAQDVNTVIYTL